jgi:5'-nucleotidase
MGKRHADGTERALVLLTNDDGFQAPGLEAMAAELAARARVVVLAPMLEQSACSHALSLHRPMRLRKLAADRWALDGTPADCVYVALFSVPRVLPRLPDLVVSGLNHGLNLGYDTYYSGTVAAAREAAIRGVTGVAVSADTRAELRPAAALCARICLAALEVGRRVGAPILLNVNVPRGEGWPVRATRLGRRGYGEGVEFRFDPRGREYLWIGAQGVRNDSEPGTDTEAFERGAVGVTSLPLLPPAPDNEQWASQVVRACEGGEGRGARPRAKG